ncbi:hypothetical protein WJX72_006086 [[Myrmecia] bisecta]|uniref:Uncharacterized protein n=1 Tax=[Myrmecia] bisecta TaxID=41462 RepID=A0AAW1Q4A9_9CHLO
MPRTLSICDSSGRPLLSRVFGNAAAPTFPTVALLSSVAQYASSVGFNLDALVTDGAHIIWQRFGDLLFVLVTSEPLTSESDLQSLLELVYLGFELLLGREALSGAADEGSADVLKRQLRSATSLLDVLLSEEDAPLCLAFQAPQVAILPEQERAIIGTALNHLASDAETGYAAIAAGGCYSAATTDFWGLHQKELLLLQALLRTLPPTSLADVPVYLPFTSPDIPLRLLTASLTIGLDLILLSGQDLTIAKLPGLVHVHFRPISAPLKQRNPDRIAAIFSDAPSCSSSPASTRAEKRRSFTLSEDARPKVDDNAARIGLTGDHSAAEVLAKLAAFALASAPLISGSSTRTAHGTQPQDVPEAADVTDMQMAVPGHRLAAATEHIGVHRRTLYAAVRADMSQAEASTLTWQALQAMPPMVTS